MRRVRVALHTALRCAIRTCTCFAASDTSPAASSANDIADAAFQPRNQGDDGFIIAGCETVHSISNVLTGYSTCGARRNRDSINKNNTLNGGLVVRLFRCRLPAAHSILYLSELHSG